MDTISGLILGCGIVVFARACWHGLMLRSEWRRMEQVEGMIFGTRNGRPIDN